MRSAAGRVMLTFLATCVLVVSGSMVSSVLLGPKNATEPLSALVLRDGMSVGSFIKENNLPEEIAIKVFGPLSTAQPERPISSFGDGRGVLDKVARALAFRREESSKNWVKILLKFLLWIALLGTVLFLMIRRSINSRRRFLLYAFAVAVFGVILGPDPSPMGTVKDTIVLLGKDHILFPPRLIALAIFLALSLVANRFICGWGCQVGTLQDLIFRLDRSKGGAKPALARYRPSFRLSNAVRMLFFLVLIVAAFAWRSDLVSPVDPFRIFAPSTLAFYGMLVIGLILVAALFVYRPWCHFFCPFGLVAWAGERISYWRIGVDRDTCIACGACAKACPSTVMEAILKEKTPVPDCYVCGSCLEVCPTGAVALRRRGAAGRYLSKSLR